MRIAIATDAWRPQISGVVTTITTMVTELTARGHIMNVIEPGMFRTVPCPTYLTVPLAVRPGRKTSAVLDAFAPGVVFIPVEGPIGSAARRYCLRRKVPFVTAYTTKWPEYVSLRTGIPSRAGYAFLKRFHAPARTTLVSNEGIRRQLAGRGFKNLAPWTRGVDPNLFQPFSKNTYELPRPIHLYMGRVAVEKNLGAFLELDLPGSKVVVGDGPARKRLQKRFPEAHFPGFKHGEDLAQHVASADVFVFPSRTDTFGIVLLEAMACGLPIAAYPVQGPRDIVVHGQTGWLDEDLAAAIDYALTLRTDRCREEALEYPWKTSVGQLETALTITA